MQQVFVFLATGFEEIEAVATIDVLRRAEINTTTVSITGKKKVKGAQGISIEADELFESVNYSDGTMLILPGGMPGSSNLNTFKPLIELIEEYHTSNKYLAAICAAPMILGRMNLLKSKEVICYPGFEKFLNGAIVSKERTIQSGKIITGKGPGAAIEFGLKIVEVLKGKELASTLHKGMIVK